jgi:hypothetical protein
VTAGSAADDVLKQARIRIKLRGVSVGFISLWPFEVVEEFSVFSFPFSESRIFFSSRDSIESLDLGFTIFAFFE